MGCNCGCIYSHRAKFRHFEDAVALANAVGPVDSGTRGGGADTYSCANNAWQQNCACAQSQNEIESPLHDQQSRAVTQAKTVRFGVIAHGLTILKLRID